MIIRKIKPEEVDNTIDLLREFQTESLEEYGFEIKEEQARELIKQYSDNAFVAISDDKIVGVLAGTINQFPLDGSRIFQEIVWYVLKSYRSCGVRLLKYLEQYCKDNGISHIVMANMSNSKAEKLKRFYLACGFQEMEVHYIKNVR